LTNRPPFIVKTEFRETEMRHNPTYQTPETHQDEGQTMTTSARDLNSERNVNKNLETRQGSKEVGVKNNLTSNPSHGEMVDYYAHV
jgi:hypothetical protein